MATLGIESGLGDFNAAPKVLSQLWLAVRERSPVDRDTDTLQWPQPYDRNGALPPELTCSERMSMAKKLDPAAILNASEKRLMAIPGVVDVGLSDGTDGSGSADEQTLRVYVTKKLPSGRPAPERGDSGSIEGLRTKVVEVGSDPPTDHRPPPGSSAPPSLVGGERRGVLPSTFAIVDLSVLPLDESMKHTLHRAWTVNGGGTLTAQDLLLSAVEAGDSVSASTLATLLNRAGVSLRRGPLPALTIYPNLDAVSVVPPLGASIRRAFDIFAPGTEVRASDLVAIALLARDDPSLVDLGRETGSDIADVREQWLRFVSSEGHRPPEEWERLWAAAGLSNTVDGPPRTLVLFSTAVLEGVYGDVRRALGNTLAVSTFDIAAAVARSDPGHAGRRIASAQLLPPGRRSSPRLERLARDRERHDRCRCPRSSVHEEVEGRLLLASLGALDPDLRHRLDTAWGAGSAPPRRRRVGRPPRVGARGGAALGPAARRVQQRQRGGRGQPGHRRGGQRPVRGAPRSRGRASAGGRPVRRPGSGKSLLHGSGCGQRVAQRSSEFSREVLQIRFNAWHYADTSLWASLAVEIFERVAPTPSPCWSTSGRRGS